MPLTNRNLPESPAEKKESRNFIHAIIEEDLSSGAVKEICTRFPPEPNGYLHIGHAKAITIDFSTAEKYGGRCNLRFDDTNPEAEEEQYVRSIQEDIKWLGYSWDNLLFASDYFEKMYELAQKLIRKGKAYVCDLSAQQIKESRGNYERPGQDSPFRERSVEENLELFDQMRQGLHPEGSKTLRAKIDMGSPNMNLRDPVLYRISFAPHHRAGEAWKIYPMYDYAHPLEDAIEGITHSLCSLEFEDHRPLYDWVIQETGWENPPKQIEFARLNLTRTLTSKRFIKKLVDEKKVDGWNDPRLSTLSGLRRKGVTPSAIRAFMDSLGVSKSNSEVDRAQLDHFVREDLKASALRKMAVLDPIKLIITNYPQGQSEMLLGENNAENPALGEREVPFSRELYIEREDFMEQPAPKYYRLYPGNEVRLRNAYFVTCTHFDQDADGRVHTVYATYDPATKSGSGFNARKVKGTIHWVDAATCLEAQVRLYSDLLMEDERGEEVFNPDSLQVLQNCRLEQSFQEAVPGQAFQFNRHGYFVVDTKDTQPKNLVFNRIVSLKDSFNKK